MDELRDALADPRAFHRVVLVRRADDTGWSRLVGTPVTLRDGVGVKLVATVGTREETETVRADDWDARRAALLDEPFDQAHVQAPDGDVHVRRTRKGRLLVARGRPSRPEPVTATAHDRRRGRALDPDDPEVTRLFIATGLAGTSGRLRADQRDKERQLQHYLELLRPLAVLQGDGPLRILDAGCGKAYMSLALLTYARRLGRTPSLTGLDREPAVIATVAGIAAELGEGAATFTAASIADWTAEHPDAPVDLLVSLHACDTATDEALAAGVRLGARAIVLAPCCHHELSTLLEETAVPAGIVRHGLLRSRYCDLVTDAFRAALLELHGYRADVIEFVAAEHTARNVMIRAERRPRPDARARERAQAAYDELRPLWRAPGAAERLLGAP
jgi:SAM-dependent methyltransferase